jgi:hypothetical protein
MARIGISINEVLRDTISQFIYTYNKYIEPTEFTLEDVTDFDFSKILTFKNKDVYNTFKYVEAPLEIFGHADKIYANITVDFNNFLTDIEDDEKHSVLVISKEIDRSIPATFFFLSKFGFKIKNLKFVDKDVNEWDDVDVLITANPIALKNKPDDKVSVKINCPYNKNEKGDYQFDTIKTFLTDEAYREKIIETKIITA